MRHLSTQLLSLSVILSSSIVFAGCFTDDLERSVTRLERSVTDLRAAQSEQTDTINSLDTQVKQLSGRLEEIEFSQNKRLGTDLTALREDLSSLKRRVPPPSIVPVSELEVDEVWANNLPEQSARLFRDALQRLREGKFSDALPLLQNVIEQTQGSDKAGVALFWEGVASDGLGDDRAAFRSYTEVVSRYPKSVRAPTSLLRQADALVKIGDTKVAKITLDKLLVDYPRSPESFRAKDQLRQLK